MSRASQLHLFDPPRPLAQRLGEEFFRAAPRTPGIYIMTGAEERVLYIGQSGNLRARLASYKNARPDRAPRKVIRLIRAVASITWEKCADAQAARLRENELLRRHRPKFNKANTYPRAYSFFTVRFDAGEFELRCTAQPAVAEVSPLPPAPAPPDGPPHSGEQTSSPASLSAFHVYGAFKARALAAFGALLRLLWAAIHQPRSPHEFPSPLLRARSPRDYRFSLAQPSSFYERGLAEALLHFLDGTSEQLIQSLTAALPAPDLLSPFQRALQNADLETLAQFYRCGPRRNFQLSQRHQLPGRLIPQEELDDLLALPSPPS